MDFFSVQRINIRNGGRKRELNDQFTIQLNEWQGDSSWEEKLTLKPSQDTFYQTIRYNKPSAHLTPT